MDQDDARRIAQLTEEVERLREVEAWKRKPAHEWTPEELAHWTEDQVRVDLARRRVQDALHGWTGESEAKLADQLVRIVLEAMYLRRSIS